jgi:hypothetical protein
MARPQGDKSKVLGDSSQSQEKSSGSYEEASGSYEEASGSYEEASGSYEEASGSYEEASGSYEEASGSYEEASDSDENSSSNEKEQQTKPTKPTKKTTAIPVRTTVQVTTTTSTVTTTTPTVTTTIPTVTTTTSTVTTTASTEPVTTETEPVTTTEEPVTTTTEPVTTTTEPVTTTEEPVTTTTSPTCDFECKNDGTCTGYNECTCITGFSGPTCEVQSVGLCLNEEMFDTEPILQITFGNGPSQYSTSTPADFDFSTTYQQKFEPVTNDGMFSFINLVHNDFNDAWHTNATDHSEDNNGYMYLVNADYKPGQFYNGRVDNLCIGLRYEFSVYLANLCKPSGKINPNILFEVRSVDGNVLLAQLESGDVAEHDTLTWEKYGFSFIATSSSVNLLMISNTRGGDGNDLVIDDIVLHVCAHAGTGFCPSN